MRYMSTIAAYTLRAGAFFLSLLAVYQPPPTRITGFALLCAFTCSTRRTHDIIIILRWLRGIVICFSRISQRLYIFVHEEPARFTRCRSR